MAKTPLHLRSFLTGAAGALVLAGGVCVWQWHPDHPRAFVSYAQQGEDYVMLGA